MLRGAAAPSASLLPAAMSTGMVLGAIILNLEIVLV